MKRWECKATRHGCSSAENASGEGRRLAVVSRRRTVEFNTSDQQLQNALPPLHHNHPLNLSLLVSHAPLH
jgi:hypothetical protein